MPGVGLHGFGSVMPGGPETPRRGDLLELEIEDLSSEGEGIGREAGFVIFVPGTLPGDRVRARITRLHRRRAEGEVVALLCASPDRIPAPCAHHSACGGCPLMTLSVRAAQDVKIHQLEQVLRRIGGIERRVECFIPSPHALGYRGRVRFAVAPRTSPPCVGFRPRGKGAAFVAIDTCLLTAPGAAELARRLLNGLAERLTRASVWPTQITMRWGRARGSWLAVLHTPPGLFRGARAFAREVVERDDRFAGIVRLVERGRRILSLKLLAGVSSLQESLLGVEISQQATTFLQVNLGAAEGLYAELGRLLAGDPPPRRMLDLYCGVGVLGLTASPRQVELLGIEAHRASIVEARRAAQAVGRERAYFEVCDVSTALKDLVSRGERFDRIALNPPRSGAGKGQAQLIRRLAPQRVVLVSCHPAAFARDLATFHEQGLVLETLGAVDMFPQTAHLEAFAALVPRETTQIA